MLLKLKTTRPHTAWLFSLNLQKEIKTTIVNILFFYLNIIFCKAQTNQTILQDEENIQ